MDGILRGTASVVVLMALLAVSSTANAQDSELAPRLRLDVAGSTGGGFGEAGRAGGALLTLGAQARLGVQITDLVALYYEAAGTIGGWPSGFGRAGPGRRGTRRSERDCVLANNCDDYAAFLHTSSVLIDFTVEWFQIGFGGGVVLSTIAENFENGLQGRARFAYVAGGGATGSERQGFSFGFDVMIGRFSDTCWVHTTSVSVGYGIY